MRVVVFVKATKDSEAAKMPTEQLLEEMGKFNEELMKAGVMLAGGGLHPTSEATRVRFSGANRTVIDGPFADTRDLVARFWLWTVRDMDEALEWVKRCSNLHAPATVRSRSGRIRTRGFRRRTHSGTA